MNSSGCTRGPRESPFSPVDTVSVNPSQLYFRKSDINQGYICQPLMFQLESETVGKR